MIVVDTSALVAILHGESEGPAFRDRIADAGKGLVSAAASVELAALTSGSADRFREGRKLLEEPFFVIEPVDADQATIAVEAYLRFGKGRHPARLNFGDTFAYALARHKDLPLLFKGNDFSLTDVEPALPA